MSAVETLTPAPTPGAADLSARDARAADPAVAIGRPSARDDAGLHRAILVGTVVLLAVLPWVAYLPFVMSVLVFALFALAFNLLVGYGGLLSFGHAAYFGGASYLTAYAIKAWGLEPVSAILLGAASAGLLGLVFGALAIRRQGIYFSMITLALAQLVYFASLQNPGITGGEDGIQGVPRGRAFGLFDLGDDRAAYALVAGVFLVGVLVIYRTIHSPFGAVLKAIRDNEPRAISLGYRTERHKLLVFVLSATLAGLAGGTKAVVVQIASLTDVHWTMSGEVILMTLIGGMGTIFGPVLGALVVIAMQVYLPDLGSTLNFPWLANSVLVVQGIVFVACVLLFREGIVGVIARRTGRSL